jgi:predicted aminopeptidase
MTRAALVLVAVLAATLGLAGCLMPRYLAQAAHGQFEILGRAEPLGEVVDDPNTPLRTAMLLAAIPEIKAYGRSYGLSVRRNYTTFAALGRPAAVWFVGAADPLAFKPRKWCFPIVGCFAGVGWFDEDEAVKHKLDLEAQGYDAIVRPAAAYSTGGWFPDPVLSTMLGRDDAALPDLFNVIIHESVHATVLVPDQPFFNESFATYVADTLTDHWILAKFGRGSPEELTWALGQAAHLARTSRMLDGYNQLKKLYDGALSRDAKLAQKAKIIDELVDDLRLRRRPNNASLTETRVYNGGVAHLITAHRTCGDLRKLVLAGRTLTRKDFSKTLQDELTPIGKLLGERCRKIN